MIVSGRLKQRSYETREGEKRTVVELDVDEVGPSLRYATAKVTRNRTGNGPGTGRRAAAGNGFGQPADGPDQQPTDQGPWRAPALAVVGSNGYTDDPDF